MKMTKEEKELLLKEICTRLPYGVKVQIDFGEHCIKYGIDRYVDDTVICVYPETFEVGVNDEDQACDIEDVKPYLRPLSNMTKEERKIVCTMNILSEAELEDRIKYQKMYVNSYTIETFDLFNSNHLDYRGLIEKGLALEAPCGMYESLNNTTGNE
jgi:hypothetical protein